MDTLVAPATRLPLVLLLGVLLCGAGCGGSGEDGEPPAPDTTAPKITFDMQYPEAFRYRCDTDAGACPPAPDLGAGSDVNEIHVPEDIWDNSDPQHLVIHVRAIDPAGVREVGLTIGQDVDVVDAAGATITDIPGGKRFTFGTDPSTPGVLDVQVVLRLDESGERVSVQAWATDNAEAGNTRRLPPMGVRLLQ